MSDIERMASAQYTRKEIDQYRSFLKPTTADEQDDFYGPIRPLMGYELSVANLDKSDGMSYRITILCIQELFANGIDDLGMEEMVLMGSELRLSMSFGAPVLNNIFSNRIEYNQKQELHEYQHPVSKPGFFSRKPPVGGQ